MRNWNGKIMVDIREFYVKDGKQMPGKKGLPFLPLTSFKKWKMVLLCFYSIIVHLFSWLRLSTFYGLFTDHCLIF